MNPKTLLIVWCACLGASIGALAQAPPSPVRMAEVVKLRWFAGLTQEETAAAMDVSRRTVNRLSTAARAWLAGELAHR